MDDYVFDTVNVNGLDFIDEDVSFGWFCAFLVEHKNFKLAQN